MKRKLLTLLLILSLPALLFAENFIVDSYDVDISVSRDRVYTVTETLVLDYTVPSHGFYRDIPVDSSIGRKAEVEVLSVSAPYSEEESSDYLSLRIGDADELVQGRQQYRLVYTYDLGEDWYTGYDEFYYNIIGSAWLTDIYDVSFSVSFPSAVDSSKVWLTAGEFGASSDNGIRWAVSDDGMHIIGSADHLDEEEAITLRVELPEGYFVGAREIKDYSVLAPVLIALLFAAVLAVLIILYVIYGRDRKLVIYPRFDAPDGFTPLDIGYLFDNAADNRDFTAMIFYWADKGYLSIEEKKKDEFILHKKTDGNFAHDYERYLFDAIFKKGDDVTAADIASSDFASVLASSVKPKLQDRFSRGPEAVENRRSAAASTAASVLTFVYAIAGALLLSMNDISLAIITFFAALAHAVVMQLFFWNVSRKRYSHGYLYLFFMGLLAVAICVFTVFVLSLSAYSGGMAPASRFISSSLIAFGSAVLSVITFTIRQRSEYGQGVLEAILGYREFIARAEVSEIKRMAASDPEFYYRSLAYAIVFSLEEEWAKKFRGIYVAPATWYTGRVSTGDVLFYSMLYSRFNNRYTARMYAPPVQSGPSSFRGGSSSFSGFSGFSGGGFGGGGGRSW